MNKQSILAIATLGYGFFAIGSPASSAASRPTNNETTRPPVRPAANSVPVDGLSTTEMMLVGRSSQWFAFLNQPANKRVLIVDVSDTSRPEIKLTYGYDSRDSAAPFHLVEHYASLLKKRPSPALMRRAGLTRSPRSMHRIAWIHMARRESGDSATT